MSMCLCTAFWFVNCTLRDLFGSWPAAERVAAVAATESSNTPCNYSLA